MMKKDKQTKINTKDTSPYSDIRQSLKDREIFITKIFKTVLGRDPSSREMSYYKYGEMEEGEISEELLGGEEHKTLMKDSKESKALKNKVKELESNIERLDDLINNKAKEYRELTRLLSEKNEEIKKLRETERNIYNQNVEMRVKDVEEILPTYSFEYNDNNNQLEPKKVSLKHNEDIFDKIRKILKIE